MLEIKNLTIEINDRYLVKNLTFTLNKKDKLAIIGEEGNGKSTILKCILGICNYANVTGIINFRENRIGYLEQSISEDNLSKKVFDYLFSSLEEYYDSLNNLYKYLDIIKLQDNILEQNMKNLSGGEKVKVSILKLLLGDYDIFFLDEPTNDLDIETLEWLETFISNTTKPIIYVSHDETLLSNTANMILHIEQLKKKQECHHTIMKTSYDDYIELRLNSIEKQTQISKNEKREYTKQQEKLTQIMNKVEYQQRTISRSDPHGAKLLKKKMHSIKSQEKKLEQVELTEKPDVEEGINFYFNEVYIPKNKIILKLEIPKLEIEDKILSKNIKLDIIGNTHLCIIGNNGIGKSTLIKLIYNKLNDRNDIKVGYMPQNYQDILSSYEYVLDFISPSKSKEDITTSRTYLGNMKFTSNEMTGKIANLSNGSKAKLILAKLVLDNCNILILDEPTRNVSPLSNPVIRRVLKEFKGTIISISHDRKYINEVALELYHLTKEGLIKLR